MLILDHIVFRANFSPFQAIWREQNYHNKFKNKNGFVVINTLYPKNNIKSRLGMEFVLITLF